MIYKKADLQTKDFSLDIKDITESGEFEGFASTFGNKDLQGDIIEPGAFKNTIKSDRTIPVLWQHDMSEPIGRIKTSDMEEDKRGLSVRGKLTMSVPKAQQARDLAGDGVLGGMSIGFTIPRNRASVERRSGGDAVRRIKEIKLWEVSLVTFPANPKATISGVKCLNCGDDAELAFSEKEPPPPDNSDAHGDPVTSDACPKCAGEAVGEKDENADELKRILSDISQELTR